MKLKGIKHRYGKLRTALWHTEAGKHKASGDFRWFSASRLVRALAAALAVSLVVSLSGFSSQCDDIRTRVLRLHVLANSDSEADQALKLKVRDTITEQAAYLFDGSSDEQEALEQAREKLDVLQAAAQKRVCDEGYDYPVRAEVVRMYFDTREYETVTLPAGMYDALRITIGEAKGRNWWCVVFPPMCVSAAENAAALSDVLEPEQERIVTRPKKYEIRFKTVEWVQSIRQTLKNWFGNSAADGSSEKDAAATKNTESSHTHNTPFPLDEACVSD